MSLISVDFLSLENQIQRLEEYLRFIEDMYDEISSVFRRLEDMKLGDAEEELRYSLKTLEEASEMLTDNIYKLKRITELYSECEAEILSAVYDLPLNMPSYVPAKFLSPDSPFIHIPDQLKTGVFSGHTIVNDQWLDDIIFEMGE